MKLENKQNHHKTYQYFVWWFCVFSKKIVFLPSSFLCLWHLKNPRVFSNDALKKNFINLKLIKIHSAVHITKSGLPASKIAIVQCACVVACVLAPPYTFHHLWHHQGPGNMQITKPIYRTDTKGSLKPNGQKITFTFPNEGRTLIGFPYWWNNRRQSWLIR